MKIFTGKVIAKKSEKTATVEVERMVIHPLYQKRYKRNKKYLVHDEVGVNLGETVKFVASKPYSKLKKWRIIDLKKKEVKEVKKEVKAVKKEKGGKKE